MSYDIAEEVTETTCYLCGGPLVDGNCLAYHWNDSIHLENREQLNAGLPVTPPGPHIIPPPATGTPCLICNAPLDAEGNCTRINGPAHDDFQSDYYGEALFHTRAEAENAPPVTFLIKDFLQREGVTGLAAPVRERKSLIALNMVHALVTGEKLFGHFEVAKMPKRVLYFCPEVSLGPFTDRVRKIGLLPYVGTRFFYRTMSADGRLELSDPVLNRLWRESVVFLDTAVRFMTGDENSASDVRKFAEGIFTLLRKGAEAVVLIHHSPKDSGDTMTLENAMRGSGDMGAFLCCCWGTRLQDPSNPYESASFMSNLKQRDWESKDFEITCRPDGRMHMVGDPATRFVTAAPRKGFKGNRDGMDTAAEAFIKTHLELSLRDTAEALKEMGVKRGKDWIARVRARLSVDGNGS